MKSCLIAACTGLVPLLAASGARAENVDWHAFKTDAQIDNWLCEASPTYAMMVKAVRSRRDLRGYRFVGREDVPAGNVAWVDGFLEIQLNPKLAGPRRVSILAFEMANAYRNPDHLEIDRAVDEGYITTPEQFGLAHEMLEYEALRLHRTVLSEIEPRAGTLPAGFFCLVTPAPPSAAQYRTPALCTYLKTQKQSGHTAHYYRWFHRRRGEKTTPQGLPK